MTFRKDCQNCVDCAALEHHLSAARLRESDLKADRKELRAEVSRLYSVVECARLAHEHEQQEVERLRAEVCGHTERALVLLRSGMPPEAIAAQLEVGGGRVVEDKVRT